jgi:hypothetical protein
VENFTAGEFREKNMDIAAARFCVANRSDLGAKDPSNVGTADNQRPPAALSKSFGIAASELSRKRASTRNVQRFYPENLPPRPRLPVSTENKAP